MQRAGRDWPRRYSTLTLALGADSLSVRNPCPPSSTAVITSACQTAVCQPQVQKAQARQPRPSRARGSSPSQQWCQRLGNVARLHLGGLGQHHRGIRRHIAMSGIARRLHGDVVACQTGGKTPSTSSASRADKTAVRISENRFMAVRLAKPARGVKVSFATAGWGC